MTYKQLIAFSENNKQVGSISAAVENGTAYFKIIGRIWSWSAEDGGKLRTQIDDAIKAGVMNAEIEGSSEGGSVFAANDLLALFQKFDDVKIKVHALMASAFTRLTSEFHTTIKKNTQGMIHMPMLNASGNVKEIKSSLKLGENVTKEYRKAYAKKTGKTEDEIDALWKDGDYWMDADELLAEGFVDAIEGEVEAFTDFDVNALAACGAPMIPEAKKTQKPNTKTKTNIMDREELIAYLGLNADATDAQIAEAKSAMKIDALKKRELDAAASTGEDEDEDEPTAEVKTLVEAALKAKKISAKEVAAYEKLATADFDSAKIALDAMVAKPKLSKELDPKGKGDKTGAQANWSFDDYLEKDPEALEALLADDPEKYAELEAAR
ncbi:Clp protease/major capsid protein [Winogradskyella phage Peternella_1]|uniref:Clp protease/major capsid protein n=1 Tax=Winogradskyella phage Peternella_1 TaxID=2745699 RepID=A0A8E4ZG32_9CAUD|nr:Clp protease/major capsid protein [Winogradskyella phage Peternella_1]QQV91575.1 Clp protease/major capsid protein [Winogradskyella phage Peternella_1]